MIPARKIVSYVRQSRAGVYWMLAMGNTTSCC